MKDGQEMLQRFGSTKVSKRLSPDAEKDLSQIVQINNSKKKTVVVRKSTDESYFTGC